jgi:hypothetical protein
MLKPSRKDAVLEERQGRMCPWIDHKKTFLLTIVSVIYVLKELSKLSGFVTKLGFCDISLKSSIQKDHQGYRKLMKLK